MFAGTQVWMKHESWTFSANLEAPAAARRLACAYAAGRGAGVDTLDAVALAVSEAVSNVVMHAYRGRMRAGDVEVELRQPDSYLCCYVRDDGDGIVPRMDSPGLGLGLPLISVSADAVEIRQLDHGGTELVMRFALP